MTTAVSTRYWISTVSREHVLTGVKGGFCQVCHGKKAPLSRMKRNDWIIYYSPKIRMEENEVCQKLTAIGRIADDSVYKFQMSKDFAPFRRKVIYLKDIEEQPIRPLLNQLSITKGRKNWGFVFRSGILQISKEDFELIYQKMTGKNAEKQTMEDGVPEALPTPKRKQPESRTLDDQSKKRTRLT